ncbi:MAG: preprotein translocase subunit SecG [Bacilli bacterium]|jgi:preprotein translocase subunit SecG|nr:preprotein translocase subunit SecG [Bacilli bacterium]
MGAFEIVMLVLSFVLIILSLLTGPKSRGASGAITGGSSMNIFAKTKERGVDKIISIITMIAGILFFLFAILATYIGK